MPRFPVNAPKRRVIRALETLGFRPARELGLIAMVRENPHGTRTPLTMPNHAQIKGATLRHVCTQVGISRDEFLEAYRRA